MSKIPQISSNIVPVPTGLQEEDSSSPSVSFESVAQSVSDENTSSAYCEQGAVQDEVVLPDPPSDKPSGRRFVRVRNDNGDWWWTQAMNDPNQTVDGGLGTNLAQISFAYELPEGDGQRVSGYVFHGINTSYKMPLQDYPDQTGYVKKFTFDPPALTHPRIWDHKGDALVSFPNSEHLLVGAAYSSAKKEHGDVTIQHTVGIEVGKQSNKGEVQNWWHEKQAGYFFDYYANGAKEMTLAGGYYDGFVEAEMPSYPAVKAYGGAGVYAGNGHLGGSLRSGLRFANEKGQDISASLPPVRFAGSQLDQASDKRVQAGAFAVDVTAGVYYAPQGLIQDSRVKVGSENVFARGDVYYGERVSVSYKDETGELREFDNVNRYGSDTDILGEEALIDSMRANKTVVGLPNGHGSGLPDDAVFHGYKAYQSVVAPVFNYKYADLAGVVGVKLTASPVEGLTVSLGAEVRSVPSKTTLIPADEAQSSIDPHPTLPQEQVELGSDFYDYFQDKIDNAPKVDFLGQLSVLYEF